MPADLHEAIEEKCGSGVGVGIHVSLVEDALNESLDRLAAAATTFPFPKIGDVSFTVTTAPLKVLGTYPDHIIAFGPIQIELNIHVSGDPSRCLGKLALEYREIRAKILATSGKATFQVESVDGPTTPAPVSGEDDTLITQYFSSKRNWERHLYMLETNAGASIPEAIVTSIRLPDIASAAVAIRPVEPFQVSIVDEYVIVHGQLWTSTPSHEGCHKGPDAEKEVAVTPNPPLNTQSPETAGRIDTFHGEVAVAFEKTAVPQVVAWHDKPKAILFIPQPALVDLTFGPLRLGWHQPPVKEHPFPFYYEYSAGASLKGSQLPEVKLSPGKLEVPVEVQLDVFGALECGVQILCIKIVVLGVLIKTRNEDPIQLNFTLKVYFQDGKLLLYSEANPSTKVDFEMSGAFPVGAVLVWVFEGLAEFFIRQHVVGLLNSLRVTLFDFGKLGIAAGSAWEAIQSTRADSILLSAIERPGGGGSAGSTPGVLPSPGGSSPAVPPANPRPNQY